MTWTRPLWRLKYQKLGGSPESHLGALKQNKGALVKAETGKDRSTEGDKPALAVWALSLGKDVFQEVGRDWT